MTDYHCPSCGEAYEAVGSHEDDAGEQACEACGFKFIVEIEYEPIYSTRCVTHRWGEPERHGFFTARYCLNCEVLDKTSIIDHREEAEQNTEASGT